MEVLNKEKVLEHAKRLIDEGKVDRAIVEYRRLLDIDPKDMRIKLRIAELLVRQKKVTDAVRVYKEVAESYTVDGFYLKAVTVYKGILRLNPSLIDINHRLAELYEKMGLNKDAVHQYQILANAFEQKGNVQGLVDVRKKIVELNPHNIANRIRLAETYQYQGMEEESINEYELLESELKGVGKAEQLIDLYEKILSYRPDNLEMLRSLCQMYYKRGEWKKIVTHLEKRKTLVEGQSDLLIIMADVYARLNQLETAKNRYKEAAVIFIESGEVDKALDAYKEILVISQEDEEEIRELVSEIDEDYFEKVKSEAMEKRRRIEEIASMAAEEAEKAEASEDEEGAEKGRGDEDTVPLYSAEEIDERLREADAAYELGKAYHNMNLAKEARPELEKSLLIYMGIERSGCEEEVVLSRIDEIKRWLGVEETADYRPQTADHVADKDKVEKTKEIKKGSEKEAKKKKKKDKRMGFV